MTPEKNQSLLNILAARVGTADWSRWQINRWQWYDYVRYPIAGTSALQYFVNPLGGTDPTSNTQKTISQTNIDKTRSFGQTYFLLEAIRTHINPRPKPLQTTAIAEDADLLLSDQMQTWSDNLLNLMQSGVLSVEFGSKDYFQVPKPFQMCPPGFGVDAHEHGSVQTWGSFTQQNPEAENIYRVSPVQLIEPEQNVDVKITFPAAVVPLAQLTSANWLVDIGVIFDGYIARPLQ